MQTIKTVSFDSINIGKGFPLALFAGPCVIESLDLVLETAAALKAICLDAGIPYVFKASYDKANRTSLDAFRGPGLSKGLEILSTVKKQLGVPIITDVHRPEDFAPVAEVADILQIPAFLCRQTDMLVAAAKSNKIVNIKKGQFMAPEDMEHAVAKVVNSGNDRVLLTDRGASFGYNTLVSDMRAIPIMNKYCPVVYDATHSVQQPGGLGGASGGKREFIVPLARAAVAAGADALFMEVHPKPEEGLSDAASMFPLDRMEGFIQEIKALHELINGFGS